MPSYIDLPQKEEFTETINEIINLKSKRKYLFETNVNKNLLRQEALGILRDRVETLRQLSRNLQSSIATANNRLFFTKDTEYISGEVKPNAPVGDYEIEILQLGSKQLLVSEPLSRKVQLPASRIEFKVDDQVITFDYKGGGIQSFTRSLNDVTKDYFTVNWVKKSEEENFFIIKANEVGDAYYFKLLKDTGDIFKNLKIFKSAPPIIKTLVNTDTLIQGGGEPYIGNMDGVVISSGIQQSNKNSTDAEYFENSARERVVSLNLVVDFLKTKSVFFKVGVIPPAISLSTYSKKNHVFVSNTMTTNNVEEGEEEVMVTNESQPIVSEDKTIQKKIIEELRKTKQPILSLEYKLEGEVKNKTFSWKDVYNERIWINDIKLNATLDKEVEFLSVKFINNSQYKYVVGKWFRSLYNTNDNKFLPLNEKADSGKTRFRFYSIEMERDKAVINDLIDGVTLNLLKIKEDEPVRFSVKVNASGYNTQVVDFINQYNYTMDIINLYLAPSKKDLVAEKIDPDFESKIGIFSSEMNIRKIKEKMRSIMEDGYIINENERPVYLQEIGMKIFISYSKPYHINSSKIELDENLFQTKLEEYGDNIKQLFRYDRNGDFVPDDGFAYRMDKLLGEYLGGNSFFALMEKSLERESKSLNKSLESEQKRIDSYRQKLEYDFAKVKQAKEQQKQMQDWLKSMGGK